MSARKATGPVAKPAPAPTMDASGVIRWADGDWVKLATDPTHGQSNALLHAFLRLTESVLTMPEVMTDSILSLIEGGALTPRDGGMPINLAPGPDGKPTPETIAGLAKVSQSQKISPIWVEVLKIREGLPSPNLLRAK